MHNRRLTSNTTSCVEKENLKDYVKLVVEINFVEANPRSICGKESPT